jgi:hypothetical protein
LRKALDKPLFVCYIYTMMNDMMPTIEEALTLDVEAQLEHEEWERGEEQRERWAALEATHGPLHGPLWWAADYEGMAWKD